MATNLHQKEGSGPVLTKPVPVFLNTLKNLGPRQTKAIEVRVHAEEDVFERSFLEHVTNFNGHSFCRIAFDLGQEAELVRNASPKNFGSTTDVLVSVGTRKDKEDIVI